MRRLTIIGATPNGDGVVLSDDKGAKFLVANDPRLPAVTDHDLSRQLEMALQTFSPREIQARVRAGASAEVIAADTGWPLDKVLRYAEPLLAERAYIAEQAQAVEVRRSGGGTTLLATAAAAVGFEPDTEAIVWDAWRREDGKWVVTATYQADDGAHTAQWSYDHAGHNIHPIDDDARLLMGVRREDPATVQFDAITDALDLIADRSPLSDEPEDEPEPRPRLVAVPDAIDDGAEEGADGDGSVDALGAEFSADVAPDYAEETVAIPHPSSTDGAKDAPKATAKKAAPRKPKARRGRASVPSWDEILFGATRPEDKP